MKRRSRIRTLVCVIFCVATSTQTQRLVEFGQSAGGQLYAAPPNAALPNPADATSESTSAVSSAGSQIAGQDIGCNSMSRVTNVDSGTPSWKVKGWAAYEQLWKEFADSPDNTAIRKYLGLPIGSLSEQSVVVKVSRGKSAPRWMSWRAGSYRQIETPHLRIYSRADDTTGRQVAEDLERLYWVWTQVFYPLWDSSGQVALHLGDRDRRQSVASFLSAKPQRLASRKKMRVVLFRDANEYRTTLGQTMPGIEQSTGFYSDERLTSYFYPDESDEAVATRRHELVHQLFREATRSGLGSRSPGMERDFWLVEGIAGYFESLRFNGVSATVGGWHSPRLQYARYRVLGAREQVPLAELRAGGQKQVQQSADLAKWYAHAIAETHHLFDGGSVQERRWVYQALADLYQIKVDVPDAKLADATSTSLQSFLRLTDQRLEQAGKLPPIRELCLSGCEVTGKGLANLGALNQLRWLDLTRVPVDSSALIKLSPQAAQIEKLTLEATRVDDEIATWIRPAVNLTELDLSWTQCGNRTANALARCQSLETLWLTGTQVTDASIDMLISLPNIQSIDVQRTQITPAGLARIKTARPAWNVNPLRLVTR